MLLLIHVAIPGCSPGAHILVNPALCVCVVCAALRAWIPPCCVLNECRASAEPLGGDELCNSSSLLVFCIFIFLPPGKLSAPSAIQRLRLHSFLCGCENLIQGFHWIDGSIQRFSPFVSLSSSNQKLLRIQTLCVCVGVCFYIVFQNEIPSLYFSSS